MAHNTTPLTLTTPTPHFEPLARRGYSTIRLTRGALVSADRKKDKTLPRHALTWPVKVRFFFVGVELGETIPASSSQSLNGLRRPLFRSIQHAHKQTVATISSSLMIDYLSTTFTKTYSACCNVRTKMRTNIVVSLPRSVEGRWHHMPQARAQAATDTCTRISN
jgi:hypothetical protein